MTNKKLLYSKSSEVKTMSYKSHALVSHKFQQKVRRCGACQPPSLPFKLTQIKISNTILKKIRNMYIAIDYDISVCSVQNMCVDMEPNN